MNSWEKIRQLLSFAVAPDKLEPLMSALQKRFDSFVQIMTVRPGELRAVEGMTDSAYILLRLAHSLGRSCQKENVLSSDVVKSSGDVLRFLRMCIDREDKEQFFLLSLDRENHLINGEVIATGSIDKVFVNLRELFFNALRYNAVSLILVHNHPGGSPIPSPEDWNFTELIQDLGEPLGLSVMDHVIITHNGTFSMAASCEILPEEEKLFRFGNKELHVIRSGIPFNTNRLFSTQKNLAMIIGNRPKEIRNER